MATKERLGGKHARAVLLLDEFRRAESAFIHKKATVAKPGGGGSLLIEVQAIPVLMSAIAGDVLQDLRSSLDHEVHRINRDLQGQRVVWP